MDYARLHGADVPSEGKLRITPVSLQIYFLLYQTPTPPQNNKCLELEEYRRKSAVSPADEGQADLGVLAQQLLAYEGYAGAACAQLAPREVTSDFIHSAFAAPVLVPAVPGAPQQLGMVLPLLDTLTVGRIAEALGYDREVRCALRSPFP